MPSLETLLVFTAAALVLNISPGPSNFYVMARSLGQGLRAGLLAACGLALGSLLHVTAAALGLSALFVYSPTAFMLFKLAGAAYLVWLGIRHLRQASAAPAALEASGRKSNRRILGESIAVEALNPKTALFFLAFLPQFVDPAAGPVAPQILLLGAIVTLSALPCDTLVATGAGSVARLIARRPIVARLQDWLSGSLLIGLGLFVALARRGD